MSEFVTVAKMCEIPDGKGKGFTVSGREIAVFFVDGEKLTRLYAEWFYLEVQYFLRFRKPLK